ncbi:hypothetical protein GQ44DRAFT_709677 [Phaeosphaeriaceae sp. PMI808]|nr:hypothetical protein GQ44DRAFT_709677 [Phaeosphaeriaceae sp. PMI808]
MASLLDQGFSIRRNGSCLNGIEVDCGATLAPFHACCPSGFTCPGQQFNVVCCRPGEECQAQLEASKTPVCSNATWDLFDNGGYFCCPHGSRGYNKSNTNGCAPSGVSVSGVQMLTTVKVGVDPATFVPVASSSAAISTAPTSVSASATPTSTGSSVQSGAPQTSSGPNVGAIAGGVVGGVVGIALIAFLAWFFLRRKKRTDAHELQANPYLLQQHQNRSELEDKYQYDAALHEADGARAPGELPATQKPVELDGSGVRGK